MFDIKNVFKELITDGIGDSLKQYGFKLKRKNEFERKCGEFTQKIYIIYYRIRGQEAANIQVNIAFRHDELEKLTCRLKGEEERKNWPSASICIGYLAEEHQYSTWLLNELVDINELSNQILKQINTYAFPLWDKYSSIEDIIEGYENKDIELTITGNTYFWRLAAAYWLLGKNDSAINVLKNWKQGRPSEEIINDAINKLVI